MPIISAEASKAQASVQSRCVLSRSGIRLLLHAVDHWRGIVHQGRPVHDAGQNDGNADVQHGANNQRGNDADGQIALRVF